MHFEGEQDGITLILTMNFHHSKDHGDTPAPTSELSTSSQSTNFPRHFMGKSGYPKASDHEMFRK